MKKAVVLLSGGIDSTVAAFCAKQDVGKRGGLHALTFDYGQKHYKEIVCATQQGVHLDLLAHMFVPVDLAFANNISTLLIGSSEEIVTQGGAEEIPQTWVPQRNSIFLALAFAYAESVEADYIYTGFNIRDYSGYPDCRPEFVEAMNKALNLASKRFVETGKGIGIICPLMYKSKSEIIRWGTELGVDFSKTWSCYVGGEKACGQCSSCKIRLAAFEELGVVDPLEYERTHSKKTEGCC